MPDWLGLDGQRVVAGGAGTIGSALVSAFLDAWASVGVLDLDVSGVEGRATSVQADLSDGDAARASLDDVRERLGGVDVPEEMTGAALFLASDDAHHITGSYMIADGGYSMLGA